LKTTAKFNRRYAAKTIEPYFFITTQKTKKYLLSRDQFASSFSPVRVKAMMAGSARAQSAAFIANHNGDEPEKETQ